MEKINNFLPSGRIYCGNLRRENIGETVSVYGWCARMRDLGGLIFIDLRDREGIVQCVFDESENKELFDRAFTVRTEFTLKITGKVRERAAINDKIPTGNVEIVADSMEIFEKADTPPFEISDDSSVNDALRLKYRYLDLRRPSLQKAMALRHRITKVTRDFFDEQGFYEIETPILTKSTPEGARDYIVPSRVHPGEFYALPQSPQQYKQMLMLAGFDRYIQIARCFRDEDLRFDRQPEFTQIDLEMSFVDVDDIISLNETFLKRLFKDVMNVDIELPILRMPYTEAMNRFGSDKPDLRFGYELCDISSVVNRSGFAVFDGALDDDGTVRCIKIDGGAKCSRKEIDSLAEYVKTYRAKGLAWAKITEAGELSSSFTKFVTPEMMDAIFAKAGATKGDLILIVADSNEDIVVNALGSLRCEVARRLGTIPENVYKLLWVTEFPLFEFGDDDDGNQRLYAKHHPFTAPVDEDLPLFETNPIAMRAKAYDIVLNGSEIGGGSIRIHKAEVQQKMFAALGFEKEDTDARFGHMIEAFRYGAPPHGGIAYGLDRIVMWFAGTENIRDVVAFPKVQNAADLMMNCPSAVDEKQLRDVSIKVDIAKKDSI